MKKNPHRSQLHVVLDLTLEQGNTIRILLLLLF